MKSATLSERFTSEQRRHDDKHDDDNDEYFDDLGDDARPGVVPGLPARPDPCRPRADPCRPAPRPSVRRVRLPVGRPVRPMRRGDGDRDVVPVPALPERRTDRLTDDPARVDYHAVGTTQDRVDGERRKRLP